MGIGSTNNVAAPTLVTSLSNINQICACASHTIFLTKSGEVYATGDNFVGQLGVGDFSNRNIPTKVANTLPSNVSSIICRYSFSFANLPPQMYSWGQNAYGETGLNYTRGARSSPQWVTSLNGLEVLDISAFYQDTFYLLSNGTLFGNGYARVDFD